MLRPFLSGVLGEGELATSAAYVRLVWRAFAIGTIAVPAAGMGAIPAQLAAGCPTGCCGSGAASRRVRAGAVRVDGDELSARAVVVATDPVTASSLLPGVAAPRMYALTTLYYVAPAPPAHEPTLHLDGTGGPLANTVVLTEAAPGYSPDRRALVSSSFLGTADRVPEPVVRRELGRLYGVPTDGVGAPAHGGDPPRPARPPRGEPAAPRRRAGRWRVRGGRPPRHPVAAGRPGERPPRGPGRPRSTSASDPYTNAELAVPERATRRTRTLNSPGGRLRG